MGLENWHRVRCDGCNKPASDLLFSDNAAAKVSDMRGYQVDAEGNWLCRDCQQHPPPPPLFVTPPGCRIAW